VKSEKCENCNTIEVIDSQPTETVHSEECESCVPTEVIDNQPAETVCEKTPDFISQIETAFARHLPENVDIDSFIKKIVNSYVDDDFSFTIRKPVLMQIIQLKDDIERELRTLDDFLEKGESDKASSFALKVSKDVPDRLNDILECYDITAFKGSEDNQFNPLRQFVAVPLATTDESLFKTVSESLSYGYERNGKVISKERVAVFFVNKSVQSEVKEE
jgi:molecular chaperone GrpE (heat shock protein)